MRALVGDSTTTSALPLPAPSPRPRPAARAAAAVWPSPVRGAGARRGWAAPRRRREDAGPRRRVTGVLSPATTRIRIPPHNAPEPPEQDRLQGPQEHLYPLRARRRPRSSCAVPPTLVHDAPSCQQQRPGRHRAARCRVREAPAEGRRSYATRPDAPRRRSRNAQVPSSRGSGQKPTHYLITGCQAGRRRRSRHSRAPPVRLVPPGVIPRGVLLKHAGRAPRRASGSRRPPGDMPLSPLGARYVSSARRPAVPHWECAGASSRRTSG